DRAEAELPVGGPQAGVAGDERLAGRRVPGRPGQVQVGMAGQQPQQLGPGVARGPEDTDRTGRGHRDNYAVGTANMQHPAEPRVSAAAPMLRIPHGYARLHGATRTDAQHAAAACPAAAGSACPSSVPPAQLLRPAVMTQPPAALRHPPSAGAASPSDDTPSRAPPARAPPSPPPGGRR